MNPEDLSKTIIDTDFTKLEERVAAHMDRREIDIMIESMSDPDLARSMVDKLRQAGIGAVTNSVDPMIISPRFAGRKSMAALASMIGIAGSTGVPLPMPVFRNENARALNYSEEDRAKAEAAVEKAQAKRDRKAAKRRREKA